MHPQLSLLIAVMFMSPNVSISHETCAGQKPVLHDDGTYSFNTESWRRAGHGVHHYGRCIEVVEPTAKLLNTWVDVLPLTV